MIDKIFFSSLIKSFVVAQSKPLVLLSEFIIQTLKKAF